MNRLFSSTLIVLSALAPLTSCGDKGMDPEDLKAGTFEATVSGEVNVTLRGCAAFVSEFEFFQIGFIPTQSGAANGLITLARGESGLPGVGTYQINEDEADAFIGLFFQSAETYTSESGTLKITSSSGANLQGSFNFTASNGINKRVTVSGTFNAKSGTCI